MSYFKYLLNWFLVLISGQPHELIGGDENPYMARWFLIPQNRFVKLFLHKFLRDDDDRALHDHPWWFISFMVRGSYKEVVREVCYPDIVDHKEYTRSAPSIAYRSATHAHRVILHKDKAGKPIPCWTIVLTGWKARDWGFYCPRGWLHWSKFSEETEKGNKIGKGCGE